MRCRQSIWPEKALLPYFRLFNRPKFFSCCLNGSQEWNRTSPLSSNFHLNAFTNFLDFSYFFQPFHSFPFHSNIRIYRRSHRSAYYLMSFIDHLVVLITQWALLLLLQCNWSKCLKGSSLKQTHVYASNFCGLEQQTNPLSYLLYWRLA